MPLVGIEKRCLQAWLRRDYTIENPCKLADIMLIYSCHDQRQRDATSVHQDSRLLPSPRSVGFGLMAFCASGS